MEQLPVGIAVFDGSGDLFFANRHFVALTGGSVEAVGDLAGPEWHGFAADGLPLTADELPDLRARGGTVVTPGVDMLRGGVPDGRWLAVSALPLPSLVEGEARGVVLVVEDIDARKRASLAAAAGEVRFVEFAEHSSCALWIADGETGEFEYLSPLARRLLERGDGAAATLDAQVHPDDRAAVTAQRHHVRAGMPQRLTYRLRDADGRTRQLRETCFYIPGRNGAAAAIGGIAEDMSPQAPAYLVAVDGRPSEPLQAAVAAVCARSKPFGSGEDLLAVADVLAPGCVLVEAGAGDAAGLIRRLRDAAPQLAIVLVAGDVPITAEAIAAARRAGASGHVALPLTPAGIARALALGPPLRDAEPVADESAPDLRHRIAGLPRRELEVLRGLLGGGTNKVIARSLGISPRTVEVHRAHLMERLDARSLPELLRQAVEAGLRPSG